jgi:4-amino-4-deoxy-L-arabinose transferase-like glycosyltransferase
LAHPAEGAPARRESLEKKYFLVWCSLLLLIAAGLRFYALGQNSLWVDEHASLLTARFPLADIPAAALSHDAFEPPVYFWLLHLVIRLLGDPEVALRLPSAVAGAVTVPLAAFLFCGLGTSSSVAIGGAALLALSPLHLWYSQEARPYALLVCLGVGALVCFARALRTQSALAWLGFGLLASLAILTHLAGSVFVLVAWLWWILMRPRLPLPRGLPVSSAGILLAIAPFIYQLAQAVAQAQGKGSPPRSLSGLEIPYTLFTYVTGYSFGPSVRDIQERGPWAALLAHPVESTLGVLALLVFIALAARARGSIVTSLVLLTLAPMTATWIGAALTGKAYNVRYTLPGIVGFVGLFALSIFGVPKLNRSIALGLVAILFLWADVQWFSSPGYWKDDSRSAVAWMKAELRPNARVAVGPGYQTGVLRYYAHRLGAQFSFDSLPEAAAGLGPPPPDALLLSRVHHLPHWRELVRSLNQSPDSSPAVELTGYRIFRAPH